MIDVFEIETETGAKRISMRSTGTGAWVTVTPVCSNPWQHCTVIRKVHWIQNTKDISGFFNIRT